MILFHKINFARAIMASKKRKFADSKEQMQSSLSCNPPSKKSKIENRQKKTETEKDSSNLNKPLGLLIGAALGDAIGSFGEMRTQPLSDTEIDQAMEMPGGGYWCLNPGEVTDDTAMALSLSRGLIAMQNNSFEQQIAANHYLKWKNSNPVDIGTCTKRMLKQAHDVVKMKTAAKEYNEEQKRKWKNVGSKGNLANGALMRCMPLIIYGTNLNRKNLYQLIRADAELTHYNPYVFVSNTAYAIMASCLIKNKEKEEEKKEMEKDDAQNQFAVLQMKKWLQFISKEQNEIGEAAKDILNEWLQPIIDGCTLHDPRMQIATKTMGYAKIAWQRATFHLWNGSNFNQAMRTTLREAGDCDTNCCIVGGLIGAWKGFSEIDQILVKKLQNCVVRDKQKMYQGKCYLNENIAKKLLEKAPKNDLFEIKD